ncbi:MAG: RNA 2',3'-cyclic phosphodiesterase [Opitutales bacterium]
MRRLFVAIELPGYVREALTRIQEPLAKVAWTPEPNFHLTLKFIGEASAGFEEAALAAFEKAQFQSFMLEVSGVGRFPEKGNPQVLWAGLGTAHPVLFQLQQRIESDLFNLGLDPGKRAFMPHITLARCNGLSAEQARQYLKRHETFGTAPFRVESYVLLETVRSPGERPKYLKRREFALVN